MFQTRLALLVVGVLYLALVVALGVGMSHVQRRRIVDGKRLLFLHINLSMFVVLALAVALGIVSGAMLPIAILLPIPIVLVVSSRIVPHAGYTLELFGRQGRHLEFRTGRISFLPFRVRTAWGHNGNVPWPMCARMQNPFNTAFEIYLEATAVLAPGNSRSLEQINKNFPSEDPDSTWSNYYAAAALRDLLGARPSDAALWRVFEEKLRVLLDVDGMTLLEVKRGKLQEIRTVS